jgi:hypothetical protein
MKDTRLMTVIAFCSVLSTGLIFAIGLSDPFFIALLGHLVGAFFLSWATIKIERVWQQLPPHERRDQPFYSLRLFFIANTSFLFFVLLPTYLMVIGGAGIDLITTVNWFAHALLALVIVLYARLLIGLYDTKWVPSVTIFLIILGLASLVGSAISPDSLVSVPGAAYPLVKPSPLFSFFQIVMLVFGGVLPALNLLLQAIRARIEPRLRWSAILFGIATFLGVLLNVAANYAISAGLAGVIAFVLLVTGYPYLISLAGLRIAHERELRRLADA